MQAGGHVFSKNRAKTMPHAAQMHLKAEHPAFVIWELYLQFKQGSKATGW